ncbi:MAG: hypothetical protein WA063_01950 [Minisyncoccia bacterium]
MNKDKINQRYQNIILFEQGIITAKQAAEAIEISPRQFFRIVKSFNQEDRSFYGLEYKSHPAWNRTNKEIEKKTLDLRKDYPEALNSHLSWLLWNSYELAVKPETIRSILINNKCYVPFSEKKERAYKKFSATHFGALIQLDTSDGYWLKGYPMIHLIAAIDDASRTIIEGGFYEHDSTLNNMIVIKNGIRKYGIPSLFYTDNDSKFKVIRHGQSRYQTYQNITLAGETETEIRRALKEAGSGLITTIPFRPQGKGKVEKLIQFIQNCFIAHHTASSLEELNQQFKKWMRWYDLRNHRALGLSPSVVREKLIAENKNAFREIPKGMDLETVFSIKCERQPNKYNIFSYQGKNYQLPINKVSYPGKVELRIMPDNKIRVLKERKLIAELQN